MAYYSYRVRIVEDLRLELVVRGGEKLVPVVDFPTNDFTVGYSNTEVSAEVLRPLGRSWVLEGREYRGGYWRPYVGFID